MKYIYIITLQKTETLLTEGLKALLRHTGKYEVASLPFTDIKSSHQYPDSLYIFLWTKDEERRILEGINILRSGGVQPILIITQHDISNEQVKQIITFGRLGIVSVFTSGQDLYTYIDELSKENMSWLLSNDIQTALLDQMFSTTSSNNGIVSTLSDKEQQILELTQRGYSTEEVAETMQLSKNTVATYRSKLIRKHGVNSMTQLLAKRINNWKPKDE